MNLKETLKSLKELGIKFEKDKQHKGRYEYWRFPPINFYYEDSRYFIKTADSYDRPRKTDTEKISEDKFIERLLQWIAFWECDRTPDNSEWSNHEKRYNYGTLLAIRDLQHKHDEDMEKNSMENQNG